MNVLLTGDVDNETLWYCPPDGSETVIPAGDVMMEALCVSVVLSVMLAVMVTLVPVVAVVAEADVVTELTDALAETIENKSDTISETMMILFFIFILS